MHHNSKLINIQLDATVCSLIYFTSKSLYMFRVPTAPVIRSIKNCNRTVPEAAVTLFSTPDDGCGSQPKHVELFCSKINQTAYCCILLDIY